MSNWARLRRCAVAAAVLVVIGVAGCETGGLLVVDNKPGQPPAALGGPSVTDIVGAGTFAQNGQYQVFYVMGQPPPNQGLSSSDTHELQGGLVGAAHSD